LDKLDKVSTFTELSTPIDPGMSRKLSLYTCLFLRFTAKSHPDSASKWYPPSTGEIAHDVQMVEDTPPMLSPPPAVHNNADSVMIEPQTETRDEQVEEDVKMEEVAAAETPASLPGTTPTTAVDSMDQIRVDDNDHDSEDQPPPAKRARKYSNADEESSLNVSRFTVYAIFGAC
jgi:hypothetical protein